MLGKNKWWRDRLIEWRDGSRQDPFGIHKTLNRQRTKFQDARILRGFGSLFVRRQTRAIEAYFKLPGDRKISLMQLLINRVIAFDISASCFCILPVLFSLCLPYAVFSFVCIFYSEYQSLPFLIALIAIGFIPIVGTITHPFLQVQRKRNAGRSFLKIFESCHDIRIVPMITIAIFAHDIHLTPESEMFQLFVEKLNTLLPIVTEDDLNEWSLSEKATLIFCITSFSSNGRWKSAESTCLQALRLLEFVGRTRTLQVIKSLMNGELHATPEMRRQAERMMPIIEERVRRTEFETTLLRASMRPDDDQNLLRPTLVRGEDLKPNELLRPVNIESETSENDLEKKIRMKIANRTLIPDETMLKINEIQSGI